jgi:hypothetical protein
MFKLRALLILLPFFMYFILPADDPLPEETSLAVRLEPEVTTSTPCSILRVSDTGADCEFNGAVAHLDFPKVDLHSVLDGQGYLPKTETTLHTEEMVFEDEWYRNMEFGLHWEPATPEFLQIHLNEYLPSWNNRIPYRLFWSLSYEICADSSCISRATFEQRGEIHPSDLVDLDHDLAADIDFNGVPAAFWNTNVAR